MENSILYISIGLTILIFYLLYNKINKPDNSFNETYDKVISSEEYKVKGQFEER